MITGEARKYNTQTGAFDGPTIAHPFSLNGGGFGAFELVARYSMADLNSRANDEDAITHILTADAIRGGREQNYVIGLNWYPNSVVRFMLDVQHVKISRLSPCTGGTSCTTTWLTPLNAQIGQSYNTIGIRSQFAF
jgi:phosphate-selective porin OprO/OprP